MSARETPRTRVVLLGTAGGPDVGRRTGTAVAIEVGDAVYLVDFGIGATLQFRRAGLDPGRLRAAFVTHLHSDHVAEAYTFFTANWYFQQRPVPMYGPPSDRRLDVEDGREVVARDNPAPGIRGTLEGFQRAFAYDNNIRIRDESMPDLLAPMAGRPGIEVVELADDLAVGDVIHEDELVRVSTAVVEHPPIWPAYAFRFDTEAGSVVLSGDTRPTPSLVELARDADLLLHEVIDVDWMLEYAARDGVPPALVNHMLASHTPDRTHVERDGTTVDGVGAVAARAGVGRLVLYHLTPAFDVLPDGTTYELSPDRWHDEAAADFGGPVAVGEDLDVYELPTG
jgi:ribonuclease BN (tRNA processing enzyme)